MESTGLFVVARIAERGTCTTALNLTGSKAGLVLRYHASLRHAIYLRSAEDREKSIYIQNRMGCRV